jgi:hypothetical protein
MTSKFRLNIRSATSHSEDKTMVLGWKTAHDLYRTCLQEAWKWKSDAKCDTDTL